MAHDTEKEIHLREPPQDSNPSPKVKPPPQNEKIPVPFFYAPSDDGTDENLLILLHGLGDTHMPFSKLARQLRLPQTAVLALRAPEQVPFLYEESYMWFPSFDGLGELLAHPDPTPALELLDRVVAHLTADCAWPAPRIHLFGFAQGGTLAAELALRQPPLGSVVSVCGPLLSYPTRPTRSATPLLIAHRGDAGSLAAFKKGFESIVEHAMPVGGGMPASKPEWEPIMRFWSQRLSRRRAEGMYEVMSGMTG
ncbi:Alpha/Beta hydrolase protein [Mycena rosella]|uniref:Alpha/Beta hydrolase protein n=1 Tax=Mycena rosella TaxID=1033263 RepID=A0AAD7M767_MYCRO|nr:Alpha/Beta hydrolase protein [Mycena rosella]